MTSNFWLNHKICVFIRTQEKILGHIISKSELSINVSKINIIGELSQTNDYMYASRRAKALYLYIHTHVITPMPGLPYWMSLLEEHFWVKILALNRQCKSKELESLQIQNPVCLCALHTDTTSPKSTWKESWKAVGARMKVAKGMDLSLMEDEFETQTALRFVHPRPCYVRVNEKDREDILEAIPSGDVIALIEELRK